jgi:phosphoribosyl-ATP pyrophosphohydrolase
LRYALREGVGAYFSRSRGRLWVKGETSGNTQKLVSIAPDCDRDALCFYVEQRGDTCHARRATCFSDDAMSWPALMQRVRNRAGAAANESYTARLLADPGLLREKLREEASELADAAHREDVAWEAADVLYFTTVRMQAAGVSVDDVMAQLRART